MLCRRYRHKSVSYSDNSVYPTLLKNIKWLYNTAMDEKDQYIAELEEANRRLQEHLEDYEDNFIRKLDSLGIGRNIDMQTFCNLITIEQFVDYLGNNAYWTRINAFANFAGQMEYTFEFTGEVIDKADTYGKRITFIVPKKTGELNNFHIERAFRSFKDFWDLWSRLTGGKKNIALLLDILEYKYNSERGKKHGKERV